MINTKTIGDFCDQNINWMPLHKRNGIDYFDISRLEPFVEKVPASIPFKRRHFYKIMLIKGDNLVQFADKKVRIKNQALAFLSPQIPYKWDYRNNYREGIYCTFNPGFFNTYYQIEQYEVFRLNGKHVFELDDDQYVKVYNIFKQLDLEHVSNYKYKFDLIRNLIMKLVHFGLKLEPSMVEEIQTMNASQRISDTFINLLEQQFRIHNPKEVISLRSPSEFAERLNIHVNHLNRSMKETLGKSTSQIIMERILKESKTLLKSTSWNVAEIAHTLGFTEATHFNNFFKKHMNLSPLKYRSSVIW